MGLFAMNMGDKNSSKEWVETAIANLQLFLRTSNHSTTSPTYCSSDYPSDHLLHLAKTQIDVAIGAYEAECEANPMINPVDKP